MNLYQNARSQAFSSFCSRDAVNLKILQSDWPRAFWHLSREKIFPKNGISARIQQIIQNVFVDQIQKKVMAKFSNILKNPIFGPFLGKSRIICPIIEASV